jgi:hypothetical protein
MHLAKLAAAALLVWLLRCSGWRHGVGRLRRTPSHSRRAGTRLLALGSDKAGAENTTLKTARPDREQVRVLAARHPATTAFDGVPKLPLSCAMTRAANKTRPCHKKEPQAIYAHGVPELLPQLA